MKTMYVAYLPILILSVTSVSARADTVALWLFDDPPGSRTAIDVSGNGYHLTLGPDAAIVGGGKFGNALDANATAKDFMGAYRSNVEAPLNPADSDWTLECWVKTKPGMEANWDRIWGISGVTKNFFDYGNDDRRQVVNVYRGNTRAGNDNIGTPDLTADRDFHHLALVYDSTEHELTYYFDGRRQWAFPMTWDAVKGEAQLQIGMRGETLYRNFEGYLDEMRFSDEVLYEGEQFELPASLTRPYLITPTAEISFVAFVGGVNPESQTLQVLTNADPPDWKIVETIDWLEVEDGEVVTLAADITNLAADEYRGSVTVQSGQAHIPPLTIPARLRVLDLSEMKDIGNRKQLFIDRRFIQRSENVELAVNPAQKMGAVLTPDSWELGCGLPARVFEEDGKFKMYYGAYTEASHSRSMAYAQSDDGLRWTKPNLGLVEIHGNKNNNVLFTAEGNTMPEIAMVYRDDRDIPQRRYKLFMGTRHAPEFDPEKDGLYAYVSADGLRFEKVRRVLPKFIDNPVVPNWDPRIGKYVIFTRAFNYEDDNQRQIGRIVTDDLLQPWPLKPDSTNQRERVNTEDIDVVLKADAALDPYSDLYYNNGFVYPWAEDVYLMFITPFRHFSPSRQPWFQTRSPGIWEDFGLIETQLAVSRDGIHWDRPARVPYFPMGFSDEGDRWTTVMGNGMIRVGNYVYQYYNSGGMTHDSAVVRPEHAGLIEAKGRIFALRQRLDGFMSADTDHEGGWLMTPPFKFKGNHLRLNIDTGAMGTAFVEMRDLNERPIPGFTLQEAEEVGGNYIDQKVYWNGTTDVSSLAGQPVRLYFKLNRAKLYAFQFAED
jgi:hypothetical protein